MEEQIKQIIKNGKKEKNGGVISLTIFGIFTALIAIISIFAHEIMPLLVILLVIDLLFILMIIDGNNHIKNPQKYMQNNIQNSNILVNKDNNSVTINLGKNTEKFNETFTAYKSKWTWDDAAKEYL